MGNRGVFKIKFVTVKVGGYKLPGLRKSLKLMKDLISKDTMLPCQPKSETWEFAIKQVDKVVV